MDYRILYGAALGIKSIWNSLLAQTGGEDQAVLTHDHLVANITFAYIGSTSFCLSVVVADDVDVAIVGVAVVVVAGELLLGICFPTGHGSSSLTVPVANVTLFSSAHLLRENTDSVRSNQRIRPTTPSVPLK
ncbi:hypothetical protein Tco_0989683 [Tanacetum coccineum]|uniref:Uncharacterized protein n=1 Tax=Tanacetum coccineum TaxID=301880 RepID=A0ABQ5EUU5_9ASTR